MDPFELEITETDFTRTALYIAIKSGKPPRVLKALQQGENIDTRDLETHQHIPPPAGELGDLALGG